MNKSLLITRPRYDLVTNYFYAWSEKVIEIAHKKTMPVYDLRDKKANREQFESYIKANNPAFIFLNGHGNANLVTGHNNEPILDTSSTLQNTIIYARSCEAARILGSVLTKNNTITFIGYTRKFIVGYTVQNIYTPLKDNLARLFLEPSNAVAITLLKGHTSQEAHSRSRKMMYNNFRKMISSTASYEERYAARWLWNNLKSQILLGKS